MMPSAKLIPVLMCAFALLFGAENFLAQTPAPMLVVQAASPAPANPTNAAAPATATDTNQTSLRLLQQMKMTNDEVLKKQQEALQRLDEIQKAAEQLKVFSKRG